MTHAPLHLHAVCEACGGLDGRWLARHRRHAGYWGHWRCCCRRLTPATPLVISRFDQQHFYHRLTTGTFPALTTYLAKRRMSDGGFVWLVPDPTRTPGSPRPYIMSPTSETLTTSGGQRFSVSGAEGPVLLFDREHTSPLLYEESDLHLAGRHPAVIGGQIQNRRAIYSTATGLRTNTLSDPNFHSEERPGELVAPVADGDEVLWALRATPSNPDQGQAFYKRTAITPTTNVWQFTLSNNIFPIEFSYQFRPWLTRHRIWVRIADRVNFQPANHRIREYAPATGTLLGEEPESAMPLFAYIAQSSVAAQATRGGEFYTVGSAASGYAGLRMWPTGDAAAPSWQVDEASDVLLRPGDANAEAAIVINFRPLQYRIARLNAATGAVVWSRPF